MKAILRASRIGRVILRYRLDALLEGTPAERWLRLAKTVRAARQRRNRRAIARCAAAPGVAGNWGRSSSSLGRSCPPGAI